MADLPRNVKSVLEAAAGYFGAHGVESPRLAGELLLARLLGCKRLELYLRYDETLSEPRLDAMRRGTRRVAAGEPIQYVLGEADFMGRLFKTDRRALIPRPETELLVETVLGCADLWSGTGDARPLIVDVGTGTGCIVLTLALERPRGVYVALDTSAEALALAAENARALGAEGRVCFAQAELSDAVEPESVTAIVSNPPYVSTCDWERLPAHIRAHEPRQALDGGPTGLAVLEAVIADAAMALSAGGRLFLEIGHDQAAAVRTRLAEAGFAEVAVRQDLAGHDRVVTARLSA